MNSRDIEIETKSYTFKRGLHDEFFGKWRDMIAGAYAELPPERRDLWHLSTQMLHKYKFDDAACDEWRGRAYDLGEYLGVTDIALVEVSVEP